MVITDTMLYDGKQFALEYHDTDTFDDLPYEQCRQIYGVCFLKDNIVLAHNGVKDTWGLVGGTIEKGETFEQTLVREIQEESNMRVRAWKPIGYQKVTDTEGNNIYQLRACCTVEQIAPFVHDTAGRVDKIAIIDPTTYRSYFNWNEIGERIIARAIERHPYL